MKKGSLISSVYSAETNAIEFTVGEAGAFSLDLSALSEELRTRAMVHGLIQKVSDAAAMPKAELTGDAKKDAKAKLARMITVRDNLVAGDWSKRSGDGSGPVAGIIFRAYSEFVMERAKAAKKTVSEEAIKEQYDKLSRSEVLSLRNHAEIGPIIERLKSERGPVQSVDTDALLAGLGI